MAKFLTGNELNAALEKLFEQAEEQIILISPYIKLHDRFASTLRTKKDNSKLEIIIVFGKNEEDLSRSMKEDDFNFFKDFPNIQIRYEKRLHAKYYANEYSAILTSMNLYNFSQDNNIEAGVLTTSSLLGILANNLITNVSGQDTLDNAASDYFKRVIDQSELLFKRVPEYESAIFGITKKYKSSRIEVDKLTQFFENKSRNDLSSRKDFNEKKIYERPVTTPLEKPKQTGNLGYCIRTGKQIPFNANRPYSDEAFQSWSKFGNEDYPEKFCHFSGESSNGETTKAKPILRKNWKKAKETHNL